MQVPAFQYHWCPTQVGRDVLVDIGCPAAISKAAFHCDVAGLITLGVMGKGDARSGMDGRNLSLSDAIRGLRRELLAAKGESVGEVSLEVDEIELRLTLEASASGSVEGGASFWNVVTGKVSAGAEGRAVHELTLKLRPTQPADTGDQQSLRLSDQRPGRG